MSTNHDQLISAAKQVRDSAHAAYSGFYVGAALQDENGDVYTGCNVENSSFPEGSCAEANAIGAMVAGGGRKIVAIAVVGGHTQLEEPVGVGCIEVNNSTVLCITRAGLKRNISHIVFREHFFYGHSLARVS